MAPPALLTLATTVCLAVACALAAPTPSGKIVGFADTHLHMVAEYGFGGHFFWGSHNGTLDEMNQPCDGTTSHGWPFDMYGESVTTRVTQCSEDEQVTHPKFTHGAPDFKDWPRWNSPSHHQAHTTHMKAAWEGGMRLAFITAMTDTLMCNIAEVLKLKLPPNREPQTCDVTRALETQVEAIKLWASQNSEWAEVAMTAADARRIASQGRLALVIAVEASYALGFEKDWRPQLARYHAMGVRQITFIHLWDNQFGGPAYNGKTMEYANLLEWLRDLVAHPFRAPQPDIPCLSSWLARLKRFAAWFHNDEHTSRTPRPQTDSDGFNKLGLTDEGKAVVQWLMDHGMFVDVSHMSRRALNDTYAISVANGYYPLMMTHGFALDAYPQMPYQEWASPVYVLEMILRTGGTFGVRVEPAAFRTYAHSNVTNNCYGSTRSLAQEVALLTDLGFAPAFGSDFNGWAIQNLPRYGKADETCASHVLLYCFDDPYTGTKKNPKLCPLATTTMQAQQAQQAAEAPAALTDLDTKGVAHVGTLADVVQDIARMGGNTRGMMGSAEAVVAMWERIDAGRAGRAPLPLPVPDMQAYMDATLRDAPV